MVKKNSLFILFFTIGFLFADPPNWEINPADYQYNGSATSMIYLNDELVGSENAILAGFVGDEVRGVVNGLFFPVTQEYSFNIMLFKLLKVNINDKIIYEKTASVDERNLILKDGTPNRSSIGQYLLELTLLIQSYRMVFCPTRT